MNIPQYLHRGDSDSKQVRKLRETINHYQLQTNLINLGNGREIKEKPLIDLINKHVAEGNSKTSFLSFTEVENIAFRFGMNCELNEVEEKKESYFDYYEEQYDWDFVITTIDTSKINISKIDNGLYYGDFTPSLEIYKNCGFYLYLINVVEFFTNIEGFEIAYDLAKGDKEWLILPATNIINDSISNEYSAIIDGGCIHKIRKYKKY